MKDSELRTRAKALALHIIAVCDDVDTRKGRSVLVNQIVRSATSIGANIHEANYAASKADFVNKFLPNLTINSTHFSKIILIFR